MSLRNKTLLSVGLILASLIVLIYLVSHSIMMTGYHDLEHTITSNNVKRAVNALDDEIQGLDGGVADWAYWDDTYAFVQGQQPDYIEVNLYDTTYQSLGLNAMIFTNRQGELVYAGGYDSETEQVIPASPNFVNYVMGSEALRFHTDPMVGVSGLIMLPEGAMIVASRAILANDQTVEPGGSLIWGRYLSEAQVAGLAEQTQLTLSIARLDQPVAEDIDQAQKKLADQELVVEPLNDDIVAGYTTLHDLDGQPIMMLKVERYRDVYHLAQRNLVYLLVLMILVGGVLGALALFWLENEVLSRVTRLHHDVKRIGQSGNLADRVAVRGKDELGALSKGVNNMLARLESSQQEVRSSNERLHRVIVGAPIFLFAFDRDGKITLQEGKGLQDLTIDLITVVGKSLYEVYAEFPVMIDHFERAMRGEVFSEEIELGGRVLDLWFSPLIDQQGMISGVTGVGTDVTDHKRGVVTVDPALTSASLLKTMSHELRTPLNAMIGYAAMLQDGLYGTLNDKQADRVQRMVENGRQLLHMINNLLHLSQIEAGDIPLKLEIFSIQQMLQQLSTELEPMLAQNQNQLKVVCLPEVGTIYADQTRLRQVLWNVLDNAAKFTQNGQITLSVMREEKDVIFQVSDTGIGIAPQQLERIFQPFVQVDGSTTRKYGGAGLGLALSRRLCELMGGQITVRSQPGRGSVFTIAAPVRGSESRTRPIKRRTAELKTVAIGK